MPVQTETCANCGWVIGALETPHVYKDKIVCGDCHRRLVAPATAAPATVAKPTTVAATPPNVGTALALTTFIILTIIGGIIVYTQIDTSGLTPRAARVMANKLATAIEKRETAFESGRPPMSGAKRQYSISVYSTSVDVEKSASEEYPKVAKVILKEHWRQDTTWTDTGHMSMLQRDYEIDATIGRKNGQWHCVRAEEKCTDERCLPGGEYALDDMGKVTDATTSVDVALQGIP